MDKILVACTNNLLRSRVSAVLARFPDIKAVFDFSQQAVYQVLNQNNFRLVILQDCLGDSECLELVDFINTSFYSTQLLILTCSPQTSVKIKYLELGADDYVTKPFSPRELVARVRAMLRRTSPPVDDKRDRIEVAGLVTDSPATMFFSKTGLFASRRRSSACSGRSLVIQAAPSAVGSCSQVRWATATRATSGRWTRTSRTCGRRSNPTRKSLGTS